MAHAICRPFTLCFTVRGLGDAPPLVAVACEERWLARESVQQGMDERNDCHITPTDKRPIPSRGCAVKR